MSFISPALIAHIFQALGKKRGCHAILLLRQHSFDKQPANDNDLMPMIVKMAEKCYAQGEIERAEEHYKLGLALYDGCFPTNHTEALRCISGLLVINQQAKDIAQVSQLTSRLEEVTKALKQEQMPVARAV